MESGPKLPAPRQPFDAGAMQVAVDFLEEHGFPDEIPWFRYMVADWTYSNSGGSPLHFDLAVRDSYPEFFQAVRLYSDAPLFNWHDFRVRVHAVGPLDHFGRPVFVASAHSYPRIAPSIDVIFSARNYSVCQNFFSPTLAITDYPYSRTFDEMAISLARGIRENAFRSPGLAST